MFNIGCIYTRANKHWHMDILSQELHVPGTCSLAGGRPGNYNPIREEELSCFGGLNQVHVSSEGMRATKSQNKENINPSTPTLKKDILTTFWRENV